MVKTPAAKSFVTLSSQSILDLRAALFSFTFIVLLFFFEIESFCFFKLFNLQVQIRVWWDMDIKIQFYSLKQAHIFAFHLLEFSTKSGFSTGYFYFWLVICYLNQGPPK